ncbi:MAG: succinate dehydrogenase, cytochrome b556 subunit [Gammaproteobacteria bacterium]|nr:succinate dehydrogenase, cytochrome b556 subunit [Gammaproteobacteria bacterium]MDA7961719.1 succinate dehydrogenase, cytochrome b556 subunit [Gammaproteobacteria bacterium]MDA7967449.1 succinate dehydrogenase, cytochrome b556 subunit [Gammaproteobacteria bacterium]MDA7969259.1 succinate dehydrogenase, cytochrome b556 subunit [Gammaproteobacteria bacterium]MDA7989512.1 succinate dehydrogenase, cytochrome b556 subunit [Gammaproteobacteria bacterium]
MPVPQRPLSPHLQVYRPQWTSVLSILHRATGMVIAAGALFVAWWLAALALGGGAYEIARAFFASAPGKVLLFIWTLCTFYHWGNGIRHLVWDAGFGFELSSAFRSGMCVLGATAALTAFAWLA